MSDWIKKNGMLVASELSKVVEHDLIVDTGINLDKFWTEFASIVHDLAPKNRVLLSTREDLQNVINDWHREQKGKEFNSSAYKLFLSEIGYLLPESEEFEIKTAHVDP